MVLEIRLVEILYAAEDRDSGLLNHQLSTNILGKLTGEIPHLVFLKFFHEKQQVLPSLTQKRPQVEDINPIT